MGKNIINRPGEHVTLKYSLCVTWHLFSTLASLLKKTLLQSQSYSGESEVNPTQGQAAPSEPFPQPVLWFFQTQHSQFLGGARPWGAAAALQHGLLLLGLAPLGWGHCRAKASLLNLAPHVGFLFCHFQKKRNHKLSEAFFSDRDERLNEVSSGSGDVWLKSISSSSGGKSESRAYKGKIHK